MTDENMDLRSLLEKTGDADFLREVIGFTVQRLLELEVESLTGAPHDLRAPAERLAQRNGYRERDWERPAAAPSSCAKAHTFPASSNPANWARRH